MKNVKEALKVALTKNAKVSAWEIETTVEREVQIYLVAAQRESERQVTSEQCRFTVHVRHDGVQGSSTVRLMFGEDPANRLDEAVYMAGLGGDEPHELSGPASLPEVVLFDPALAPERILGTARELGTAWIAAAQDVCAAGRKLQLASLTPILPPSFENAGRSSVALRPSSGELFCTVVDHELENSAGFRGAHQSSRISALSIVLAASGDREAERVSWEERRRVSDLDLRQILGAAAWEAGDLARAETAPSGVMPVVIDADEFGALFSPIVDQASAEGIYDQSTRFELGKPLPIEAGDGEKLTLFSNAILPYGLNSYRYDNDGVPGARIEVVRDNVFTRAWATKRYADYLKREVTGDFGNLEIASGKTTLAALYANGPVLLVRSFSWLTPDGVRGDFSSEIRLGYLIDGGTMKPIKGGSVSGNLFSALARARFCDQTVFRGDYQGPGAVRFEGVSVSGL